MVVISKLMPAAVFPINCPAAGAFTFQKQTIFLCAPYSRLPLVQIVGAPAPTTVEFD